MDNKIIISIAKDFSITPGPRTVDEGSFSGEKFRNEILEPKFEEAIKENKKITINLDGTLGYGPSFLEEAFGGLARKYNSSQVLSRLEFISLEEPYLLEDVAKYIENANK